MNHRFQRFFTLLLAFVLTLLPSLYMVTPAMGQTNQITYGLIQDPTNPLLIKAVAVPNFTSTSVTISSAVFSFLLPEDTVTSPVIPPVMLGTTVSGSFTNTTGTWGAQRLTPSVYGSVPGLDEADLEGYDVYQVVLGSPGISTTGPAPASFTAGVPIELFSFVLPVGCFDRPIQMLPNGGSIWAAINANFGSDFNNFVSATINGVPNPTAFGGISSISIPITCPLDSDSDGIPDTVEVGPNPASPLDTDGDNTPDYLDTDSDADGINDSVEAGPNPTTPVDSDGDGIPDYRDSDSDNDGILDIVEGNGDSDTDGILNRLDLDSDNDGINDVIEAGGTDANGDGRADGTPDSRGRPVPAGLTPLNSDSDATPNYLDLDSDNDGIPDVVEGGNAAADTNGDGVINSSDTNGGDSDGDGIANSVDGLNGFGDANSPALLDSDNDTTPDYRDTDSDGDGIDDSVEGATDSDGDGIPNYRDRDSDNDGILDAVEGATDTDGDGVANYLDLDSDNDGVNDVIEAGGTDANGNGQADGTPDSNGRPVPAGLTPANSDSDATPNYLDLDSDNDGIPDVVEGGNAAADTNGDGVINSSDTNGGDSDGDGIANSVDGLNGFGDANSPALPDSDNDTTPDYRDTDSDNDGINDSVECASQPCRDSDNDTTPDYRDGDSDNDGINDIIECSTGAPCPDSDRDGTPDFIDTDSDNDGISDQAEGLTDSDGDGLPNRLEPNNRDTDDDGTLDHLDADDDGDGISTRNEGGADGIVNDDDTDADGIPNHLDSSNGNGSGPTLAGSGDSDGDGIPDGVECPTGNPCSDTNGDGTPDYTDLDSDGDGIPDSVECPTQACRDTDVDTIPDYRDADDDGDGIPTALECPTGAPCLDTDGDGTPNHLDTDSDGDGINDATEAGANPATPTDSDGDGIPNYLERNNADTDGDTIPNHLDADDDGDTIPTSVECPAGVPCPDTDDDNVPDYLDTDSDNDRVSDEDETNVLGTDPLDSDSDSNRTPANEADNDISDADEDFDGDGYTNEEELDAGTDPLDPTSAPGVLLSVKVLLQAGLLDPLSPATPLSVMRDTMRAREQESGFTGSFFPRTSPYGDGAQITNAATILGNNGNNSAVDWVQIQLRSATAPATVVAQVSGLVQRDGDVMTIDGSTTFNLVGVGPGSYFVAVLHRNHLGAMIANPVSLSGVPVSVDFTNTSTDFWNNPSLSPLYNGAEQFRTGTRFALWAGDADDSGRVRFSGVANDVDALFNAIFQSSANIIKSLTFELNGYRVTDVYLTGTTRFAAAGNGTDLIFNVVNSHPANALKLQSFAVVEQLP